MKNKNVFYGFLFIIQICSIYCNYKTLSDLDSLKGMQFGQKYTNLISGGKISFEYTESQGTFCKANKDLHYKEVTLSIPKEHIISCFDFFPFKFELRKAIHDFLFSKPSELTPPQNNKRLMGILFVYQLMFLNYKNKDKIYEVLRKHNYNNYILNETNEVVEEFLDSLPPATYTYDVYTEKDKKLLHSLLMITRSVDDYEFEIFEHVDKYMRTHYSKVSEAFLPWTSDSKLFNYFMSVKRSRAYELYTDQYIRLHSKEINSLPMWKLQNEVFEDMWSSGGICLIPFADLCNHQSPDIAGGTIYFDVSTTVDYLKFSIVNTFKKGEEYMYSYKKNTGNVDLLVDYGFYVQDNPETVDMYTVSLQKSLFNKYKSDLCSKLNCYEDENYKYLYEDSKYTQFVIHFNLNKFGMNKNALNLYRISFLNNDDTSSGIANKKEFYRILYILKLGGFINIENELKSLAKYREDINKDIPKQKISIEDIIYSLHNTREYYKEKRENIRSNTNLLYTYKLRRRIMEVGREYRKIRTTHTKFAQDGIKKVLSNQFAEMRNLFKN